MADIKPPKKEEPRKSPIKIKSSKHFRKVKYSYCILCRKRHLKHEGHEHMHSMLHHRELETCLGKDAFHDCQACKIKSLGLNEYAMHISTTQHKVKLNNLKTRNIKPICLLKTLTSETIKKIHERNKTLRNRERKAMKKNRKKQKQNAAKKHVKNQEGGAKKKTLASKGNGKAEEKSQQMQARTPKQWPQTPNQGSNTVVQNKENKMFSVQSPGYYRGPPFHNPNWRPVYPPGVPGSWPFLPQFVQNPFNPPAFPPRYPPPFGNYQYNQSKFENLQFDGHFKRPYDHHVGAANAPKPDAGEQSNCYNTQHDASSHNVLTSQQMSDNGDVLFDQNQAEKTESSQLEGSGCSAQPASANKPTPIQDIDVTAVLKRIRRELGVREPCRADREARKQNTKAAVQADGESAAQQTKRDQPAATASTPAAIPPQARPVEPKQTRETSRFCKKSSAAEDGDANARIKETPAVASGEGGSTSTTTETNVSNTRKVRIAHRSAQGENVTTVHKPVLDKLLSYSGARSKINWREMYNTKKNQRDRLRFKTELVKHPTDDNSPVQEADLPLSEGFHWESIPESPSVPLSNDGLPETQMVSQMQDSRKSPDAAQAASSRQPARRVSVKVEPEAEDETNTSKRKCSNIAGDGVSSGKKKKKSNKADKSQMDQLLAVSLREDELSCSLQDLDKSLVQARNALQAAYAEVQRLLLLKQQFTGEVNSLRTKRIEILQGLQASSAAGTSSGIPSTVSPPSFLSSGAFSTPPSHHPASITQPPPAVSVKQEVCLLAERADVSTPDTPPVPPFPSDLLQPPRIATGAASPATQPPAESSTPAKSPARDPSAIKMEMLEREWQPSESESVEETGGNFSKRKRKQLAANKPAPKPKKQRSESEESDSDSDSDSSVEMINSSVLEVIDIEESDCESSVQPEVLQTSVSVDVISASTQTSQQSETESKFQTSVLPPKDAKNPPESFEDDGSSLGMFSSHGGPVHGLQVHNGLLYTCSGDNTAHAYSLVTRECEAVFLGHTNKVNCLLVSSPLNSPARLYTGSSDQTIRCYSIKSKKCLEQITLPDRVLCLHIAWNILYAGLASGSVSSFDLKTLKDLDVFECHGPRGVSCLGTAQEGARRLLLVGSYDSTISVRDAKSGLLLRLLEGHTKTVLCMKVVNDLVFSGSSDTSVHAHNIHTGELVRIYKGHGHAVTSIVILGKVMVTACLDKLVRVYELQSHDRLQVYGGHSDMVMCMAVHKSVIYTGCYDGTVQAVKLNLMKNHRCWWQSCSLIFGVPEHLLQHLLQDHSNQTLHTVKCRWKDCNTFFATQQAVKQELPDHMQNHIENDSKL